MTHDKRNLAAEFRGLGQLLVQATKDTTTVVENVHREIIGGPAILGRPLLPFVKLPVGIVYGTIRGITGLVGKGLDTTLAQLEPAFSGVGGPAEYEIVKAALNGVVGDHLAAQGNPLAITMSLRDAESTEIPNDDVSPRKNLLVYLHGSAMDDTQLTRRGVNHGKALAEALGYDLIYVRYNSGLHISENGRELADKLEDFVRRCGVASVILLGFSMGGLVARSAVHIAEEGQLTWPSKLSHMVFMGTPHHGSPLERYGNLFESLLGLTPYSRPIKKLSRLRSAGVTDLRYGNILEEHWQGRDRFDLTSDPRRGCTLPSVPCFAIAGFTGDVQTKNSSDGLVPVDSALGHHLQHDLDLGIPADHTRIFPSHGHLDLLSDSEISNQILAWLAE